MFVMPEKRPPVRDWSKINLDRPTKEIAAELGITASAVSHQKVKAGKARRKRDIGATIDWNKSDRELARQLGVSKSMIYRRRIEVLNHREPRIYRISRR